MVLNFFEEFQIEHLILGFFQKSWMVHSKIFDNWKYDFKALQFGKGGHSKTSRFQHLKPWPFSNYIQHLFLRCFKAFGCFRNLKIQHFDWRFFRKRLIKVQPSGLGNIIWRHWTYEEMIWFQKLNIIFRNKITPKQQYSRLRN